MNHTTETATRLAFIAALHKYGKRNILRAYVASALHRGIGRSTRRQMHSVSRGGK